MKTSQKGISLITLILFFFSFIPIQTVNAATLTVTNTNDSGTGSLRQTIADASSGDTIIFDDALSGSTITLTSDSPLGLLKSLTIDGSSLTSPISISGNSRTYVFYVNSGVSVILDSLIIKNGYGYNVGGIYNTGDLTVNHCTFFDNSSTDGGGGISSSGSGTLTVNNSTFSNNSAGMAGGGILTFSSTTVNNSTFSGNSAPSGGGIYSMNETTTLLNSTFYNNYSRFSGGGILNGSDLIMKNNTFSGNSAGSNGGGIYNTAAGEMYLSNNIIANSPSGLDCYNNGGSILTNINNLIESHTACGTPAYTADPLLAPLADNGGDTQTMALLPGSVAINAGDNATCTSTDQRGVTRTLGGTCDIGAYEAGASILNVSSSSPLGNTSLLGLSSPTSITVNFNEDALHDGSNKAANYNNNYMLVERGSNNTFDTQSCADGPQADDTTIPFTVSYDNSTFTSTLTLANPLPPGSYRLFVCGTTSIWSAAGLELNNGDSDTLINFSIANPSILPATGFPMGLKTDLPAQPASKSYNSTELTLEIPAMDVNTDIVGVSFVEDTWDVSWLGANTGWLEGSAAPTWTGNTVLTGHVWDANNQPGIFANLKSLKYGEQFQIHAWGQTYTYEVRENKLVSAGNTTSVLQHEELDWVTLLTCESYNPNAQTYPFRRMVRAVLVSIE